MRRPKKKGEAAISSARPGRRSGKQKSRSYAHQDRGRGLALAKLGKKAKVSEIQSFVKENFDIEITAGHAKNAKGKFSTRPQRRKRARSPHRPNRRALRDQ